METVEQLRDDLRRERVMRAFAESRFVAERLSAPAAMLAATFSDRFKVERGRLVATDAAGRDMLSRSRPGEPMDFDEAIAAMVQEAPFGQQITRAGAGEHGAGPRTLKRAEFNQMTAMERMRHVKAGGKVVD